MIYQEYQPVEPLSDYIQLIWIAESESPDDHYPREKILPDGIVEIVFHFGDPFITYNAAGETLIQPQGFAISQMQKFIEIESNGAIGFVSIRFYPWGAHHFFETPVNEFIDNTIELNHLWGDAYKTILQQIKNVDNNEKVHIIQRFLSKCLSKYRKNDHAIDDAIKLIRDLKGQCSIKQVCDKTDLNLKQLERKFLKAVGTTPKTFSRTTRFLYLCHHLQEYENKTMAQLAYELGYYDQAHFIRDFKAFSGLTPKAYYQHHNICFADF